MNPIANETPVTLELALRGRRFSTAVAGPAGLLVSIPLTFTMTGNVILIRVLIAFGLLFGLVINLVAAPKAPDKKEFLSRKKWYVSFTFKLQGKGNATITDGENHWTAKWDILREITGTYVLDEVRDHHPKKSKIAEGESLVGRFISWQPSISLSSVSYLVSDRISHESISSVEGGAPYHANGFIKFSGAGTTEIGLKKSLACDLNELIYDFELSSLWAWNRDKSESLRLTGEFHSKTPATGLKTDMTFPLTPAKIIGNLPELPEELILQLKSRPLLLVDGKLTALVAMPVTQLPNFPAPAGSIPFGPKKYNNFTTNGGLPLTLSLAVTLSPTPPTKARLLLKPHLSASQATDWRPLCSDSEDKPGNNFPVDWRIEEEGGDPGNPTKVKSVSFELLNTSNEPGVCMNRPLRPVLPSPFDLKFAATTAPGYDVAGDGQKLQLSAGQVGARKGMVTVDCFDAGATGELVAEAQLEDGRVLRATIEPSNEVELRIPNYEPGVSWMARGWRNTFAPGLTDESDDENLPVGDGQRGDGLTVWEEYRGFWVDGRWEAGCDPRTKDLFVSNNIGPLALDGLLLFRKATGLIVHDRLSALEVRADRTVNFNHGSRPHLVDQHCLVLVEGEHSFDSGNGRRIAGGAAERVAGKDFPGPPKNTLQVVVLASVVALIEPETQTRDNQQYQMSASATTVAHELMHGLGVHHHGDNDALATKWTWEKNRSGEIVFYENGVEVIPRRELNGLPMVPDDIALHWPEGEERLVYLGEQHGTMSGDDACIMRYHDAVAYRSLANPKIVYFHRMDEMLGNRLCVSPAGAGVNLASRQPQSRYGNAASGHGDCSHKFVVSDRWEKKN